MNLILACLALTTTALAQDDDWGDDDWGDDGDDVGFADAGPTSGPEEVSPWTLSGYLRTQEALWINRLDTEPLGLSRQTAELTVRYRKGAVTGVATGHGEIDPYYLTTDNYDDATRDVYGYLLQPRELFVAVEQGAFELSAGRQKVTWGEGVMISPVNVINAPDLRDPGTVDLSDARLPVTMLRASAFLGDHRLEVMLIPEADFGLRSSPEGPFGPIPGIAAQADVPEFIDVDDLLAQIDMSYEHNPGTFDAERGTYEQLDNRWSPGTWQYMARWGWRGRGVDLGVYGGRTLDKLGTIGTPEDSPNLIDPELTEIAIPLNHATYWIAGLSGAAAVKSVLFRWEGAAEINRPYNIGDIIAPTSTGASFYTIVSANTVYTGMLGVGYTGLPRTRIDVELSDGIVKDGGANLTFPVAQAQLAARASHSLMRERIELVGLFAGMGLTLPGEDDSGAAQEFDMLQYGWFGSLSGSYELADGLHGTLGYVTYHEGEELSPLIGFNTHDRLFAQVRWYF